MGGIVMLDRNKIRCLVIILIPLFLSILINRSFVIMSGYVYVMGITSIIFVVYWFWCGMKFAEYDKNKIKSFVVGNSIWAISFILFIWQFVLVDGASRYTTIAIMGQYYQLFMVRNASRIIAMCTNTIHSINVSILAYILMIILFSLGFVFKIVKMKKDTN